MKTPREANDQEREAEMQWMREKLAALSSQEKESKAEIERLRKVNSVKSEQDSTSESESWDSIDADKYDDSRVKLDKELRESKEETNRAKAAAAAHATRREAEEKSRRQQLRDELAASKAAAEEAERAARKVKQKLKKAKAKARAKSEKSDSESSSSSDTESGADERSEEAKAIERLKADGNADYEEQALDVLWSTFVIQKLVNDVGGVDKTTPRTLKELIQWKRKTLDTEFKNLARMVKQGGAELRKTITELYQRLMRTEQLGVCVAAAAAGRGRG